MQSVATHRCNIPIQLPFGMVLALHVNFAILVFAHSSSLIQRRTTWSPAPTDVVQRYAFSIYAACRHLVNSSVVRSLLHDPSPSLQTFSSLNHVLHLRPLCLGCPRGFRHCSFCYSWTHSQGHWPRGRRWCQQLEGRGNRHQHW